MSIKVHLSYKSCEGLYHSIKKYSKLIICYRSRRDRGRIVVGITTTYTICEFESRSWRGVSTQYNAMWKSLSVTCTMSVVFSGYSGFLHQLIATI